MAINANKTILLAKKEAVYATDPTPTAAANAIEVMDLSMTPMVADEQAREIQRRAYGNYPTIKTNKHQTISFKVSLAGSGAKGTPPAYGELWRACGMAEAVTAATDVKYNPITDSPESVTLYYFLDNQRHKLTGARGSAKLVMNNNQFPTVEFSFTGRYHAPAEVAPPAVVDTSRFKTPLDASQANTPTASLFGHNVVVTSLEIDLANEVRYREAVNYPGQVRIEDRKPAGSITIDAPSVATKNYFADAAASTTGALRVVHGTADGNIIELDAPSVELGAPAYAEDEGVKQLQMPLRFLPVNGNDELKFTVR